MNYIFTVVWKYTWMYYIVFLEVATDLASFATSVSNSITDGVNPRDLNRFDLYLDCPFHASSFFDGIFSVN